MKSLQLQSYASYSYRVMQEAAASKVRLVVTRDPPPKAGEPLSLILCNSYFLTKVLTVNTLGLKLTLNDWNIFFSNSENLGNMVAPHWVAAHRTLRREHLGAGECSSASCVSWVAPQRSRRTHFRENTSEPDESVRQSCFETRCNSNTCAVGICVSRVLTKTWNTESTTRQKQTKCSKTMMNRC